MATFFSISRFGLGLVLLMGLVTLAACGRDRAPVAVPESNPRANVPPSSAQSELPADQRFDLPDLAAALETLDRYEMEMILTFSGQDSSGLPLNWQLTSHIQEAREQAARRFDLQVNGLGDGSQLQALSAARIGSESYLAVPGVGCLAGGDGSVNLGEGGPAAPVAYLSTIRGAEIIGGDNDLSAGTYHFDQDALPGWPAGQVTVEGQLSIAPETGIPNHVELIARGAADYLALGQAQNGTLQLTLDIRQMSDAGQIQPPVDCLDGSRYPMVSDAFAVTTVDEFVSFQSRQPFSEVVTFYQTQMPGAGWVESEEAIILDGDEPVTLLIFQRQGTTVTISINLDPASGMTTVLITP